MEGEGGWGVPAVTQSQLSWLHTAFVSNPGRLIVQYSIAKAQLQYVHETLFGPSCASSRISGWFSGFPFNVQNGKPWEKSGIQGISERQSLCATFNFKYVDTLLLISTPYTSLLDQKFCEKKLDLLFSFSTLTRVPENAPESSMHQWFLLLIQVLVISFPCSYRWGLWSWMMVLGPPKKRKHQEIF